MNVKPGDFARVINSANVDPSALGLRVLVLEAANLQDKNAILMSFEYGQIWNVENIDRPVRALMKVFYPGQTLLCADSVLKRIDPPQDTEDVFSTEPFTLEKTS